MRDPEIEYAQDTQREMINKLDSSDNTLYRIEQLLRESLENQKWQINDLREQVKDLRSMVAWLFMLAVALGVVFLAKAFK